MTHESEDTKQHEWHALEAEAVLKHLKVQDHGLTSEEVQQRLEKYGENQLNESPPSRFSGNTLGATQ